MFSLSTRLTHNRSRTLITLLFFSLLGLSQRSKAAFARTGDRSEFRPGFAGQGDYPKKPGRSTYGKQGWANQELREESHPTYEEEEPVYPSKHPGGKEPSKTWSPEPWEEEYMNLRFVSPKHQQEGSLLCAVFCLVLVILYALGNDNDYEEKGYEPKGIGGDLRNKTAEVSF